MRADDPMWEHWVLAHAIPSEYGDIVPFVSHGDEVPVVNSNKMKMNVISSRSVWGSGPALDTHWLYSALNDRVVLRKTPRGNLTAETIWKTYVWDVEALGVGEFSARDQENNMFTSEKRLQKAGDPICDLHQFAHIRTTGDGDWFSNELELTHWRELNPCGRCHTKKIMAGYSWFDCIVVESWGM